MAIDSQAQAVLDLIAKSGQPPMERLTPIEARKFYRDTRGALSPRPTQAAVESFTMAGPGGRLGLRLYRPAVSLASDQLPVLVYYHGGGWTIGDLDTHDVVCRHLANAAVCALISVDYRLAPEHKFPAALLDAAAALDWVAKEGSRRNLDTSRLAVGGDSAGGTLATVAALLARDAGGPQLKFQLLFYPATDLAADTPSHRQFAEGYGLTANAIRWFAANYLREPADYADWRASPLKAPSLAGLPPALIVTAGFDPLLDEGKAYADRLNASGVAAGYRCYEGQIHGFITMGKAIADAGRALDVASAAVKAAFNA